MQTEFIGRVGPALVVKFVSGIEVALLESANGDYASNQRPPTGSDAYLANEARQCLAGNRHRLNWNDDVMYFNTHGHPALSGFFCVPSEKDACTCQACAHAEWREQHGNACPACGGSNATRECTLYHGVDEDLHRRSIAPARHSCADFAPRVKNI